MQYFNYITISLTLYIDLLFKFILRKQVTCLCNLINLLIRLLLIIYYIYILCMTIILAYNF